MYASTFKFASEFKTALVLVRGYSYYILLIITCYLSLHIIIQLHIDNNNIIISSSVLLLLLLLLIIIIIIMCRVQDCARAGSRARGHAEALQ